MIAWDINYCLIVMLMLFTKCLSIKKKIKEHDQRASSMRRKRFYASFSTAVMKFFLLLAQSALAVLSLQHGPLVAGGELLQ